jgi:hypothetical protein
VPRPKKPSMKPFDQSDFETPDTMARTPDGRPDVAGYTARLGRSQALNDHTNRTMEAGLRILREEPQGSTRTWKVVALLFEAEPRYRRLGGKIPYWPLPVYDGDFEQYLRERGYIA